MCVSESYPTEFNDPRLYIISLKFVQVNMLIAVGIGLKSSQYSKCHKVNTEASRYDAHHHISHNL